MIVLEKITDVELTQHAVIEASAGTGKTYTIIQLVLRLLIEEQLPLERILLVTFTDKATNELRNRIGEGIQQAIIEQTDVKVLSHLNQALKAVNQAPIHTINAFCQKMLREYAFEQGGVFEFELVNDYDVYQQQLLEMKRHWPNDEELMLQIEALGIKNNQPDDLLLALMSQVKDPEQLRPKPASWSSDSLKKINIGKQLDKLVDQFSALKGPRPKNKTVLSTLFKDWLKALVCCQNDDELLSLFTQSHLEPLDKMAVAFNESNSVVNEKLAPEILALKQVVDQAKEALKGQHTKTIIELLKTLKQKSTAYKLNHGLISYDDMITRLSDQLRHESHSSDEQFLTRQLRFQYKVAIIDEFQDTSPEQWQVFKHIFLQSKDNHRLWVIGDPKQAIYGFRGADLHTYWQATKEMLEQYQAIGYRLTKNYRSLPTLLQSFNAFFGADVVSEGAWWPSNEVNVNPAPTDFLEKNGPHLVTDQTACGDIAGYGIPNANYNADTFRLAMAESLVGLIQHKLLGQMTFQIKGLKQTLSVDDVCILVNAAKDVEPLETAFDAAGIPHYFHKKKSLYLSDEAFQFEVVLTALVHSKQKERVNNAMVTIFFGLQPEQLKAFADEHLPEVSERWLRIKEMAQVGDWIAVFDILVNESPRTLSRNDRQYSTCLQLKNELCQLALSRNWDSHCLLQWLSQKRKEQSTNNEDFHVKAVTKGAVNIMTMHVSKGLEFPVVFIYGGFGRPHYSQSFSKYYCPETDQLVIDLNKNNDRHRAYEMEERKRLYYVAMTRAVFKLFLPIYSREQFPDAVQSYYWQCVNRRAEQLTIPVIQAELSQRNVFSKNIDKPVRAAVPAVSHLLQRKRTVVSFSSLTHRVKRDNDLQLSDGADRLIDQGDMVLDQPMTVNSQRQLPGGIKTGHVLHGIFEHVEFHDFKQISDLEQLWKTSSVMSIVDTQMKHFRLENGQLFDEMGQPGRSYRQELAAWVWHTLKKPLVALDGGVLADLQPKQKRHEMAFFWQKNDVYLSGFIDLLFFVEREGRQDYYILDWKSNHSSMGYSPQVLSDEVMTSHQYHWQYQLYGMAVQKWFDSLSLENARLAGAIYPFSRGIDCQKKDNTGVFFDDFSLSSYDSRKIESQLLSMVKTMGVS